MITTGQVARQRGSGRSSPAGGLGQVLGSWLFRGSDTGGTIEEPR